MAIIIERLMAEDIEFGVGSTSKTHPGGGILPGHQVSLSSFATVGPAGLAATLAWDPGTVSNGASTTNSLTVQGAAFGDYVLTSWSADQQGLILSGYVSAPNTVTVVFSNLSGAPVDLPSGTLKALVFKAR